MYSYYDDVVLYDMIYGIYDMNFAYTAPDATNLDSRGWRDKLSSGYYDGDYFVGSMIYGDGFYGPVEDYGYNHWWYAMPAASPNYSVGDTVTVVSFSSTQSGDNEVDAAFELVGAGSVGSGSSSAAGLVAGAAIVLGAASLF